jgi:hypothetical protein
MRADACKNELDIDADSFIYGDCPQDTHRHSHNKNEGDDVEDTSQSKSSDKNHRVKFPSFSSGNKNDDEEDEEETAKGEDDLEGSGDDGYSTGNEDDDDNGKEEDKEIDADEEPIKKKGPARSQVSNNHNEKSEEDDLKKSMEVELCHHLQCPIGSLCRVRLRKSGQSDESSTGTSSQSRHQKSRHEAFCDCDEMCSRITDLDLETPGWIREEVCGSNGLLYRSECQLRQESCQRDQIISLTARTNCNGTYAHEVLREVKSNNSKSSDFSTPAVTSLHWSLQGRKNKKTSEGDHRPKGKHSNKTPFSNKNDMNRGITNHRDKNHHHHDHQSENESKNRNDTHSREDGKKTMTTLSPDLTSFLPFL